MLAAITFVSLICLNLDLVYGLNLTESCGRSHTTNVAPDWRIVGGTNTAVGEFPWQIIMTRKYVDELTGNTMMEMCGGTIISSQWILTAAHCVMHSKVVSEYSINLGVHNTQTSESTQRKAGVSKVIQILFVI